MLYLFQSSVAFIRTMFFRVNWVGVVVLLLFQP
jgi:hypothetical protein